jgi:hypothetical protein
MVNSRLHKDGDEQTEPTWSAERIVLRKGLGKDGDPRVQYFRDHPTHYEWVARVSRRAHRLVNAKDFRGKIWVVTYFKHPPAFPREHLSMDVWGYGGRGDPIDEDLGYRVFDWLFNDPRPPDVWWCIWQNRMYVRDPKRLRSISRTRRRVRPDRMPNTRSTCTSRTSNVGHRPGSGVGADPIGERR